MDYFIKVLSFFMRLYKLIITYAFWHVLSFIAMCYGCDLLTDDDGVANVVRNAIQDVNASIVARERKRQVSETRAAEQSDDVAGLKDDLEHTDAERDSLGQKIEESALADPKNVEHGSEDQRESSSSLADQTESKHSSVDQSKLNRDSANQSRSSADQREKKPGSADHRDKSDSVSESVSKRSEIQ